MTDTMIYMCIKYHGSNVNFKSIMSPLLYSFGNGIQLTEMYFHAKIFHDPVNLRGIKLPFYIFRAWLKVNKMFSN